MIPLTVGERLRALIKLRRLQGKELADRCNLPQATISQILNGHVAQPRLDTLKHLAGQLDVTPEYLAGWVETDKHVEALLSSQSLQVFLTQGTQHARWVPEERLREICKLHSSPKTLDQWNDLIDNIKCWMKFEQSTKRR